MKTRFKKGAKIVDIMITAVSGTVSVAVMLYGIFHFGLSETWPELVPCASWTTTMPSPTSAHW